MSNAVRSNDSLHQELERHGLTQLGAVYRNLPAAALYEESLRRGEVELAAAGPIIARTAPHTGRAPNDRYIVRESSSEDDVWWGKVNVAIDEARFDELHRRVTAYFQHRDIFVQDCLAGADPEHRVPVRIVTEEAWHSLFARNMFIRSGADAPIAHEPRFTVLHAPRLHAIPEVDGLNSSTGILVHIGRGLVLILGTSYAGEIKKSIFGLLNHVYPAQGVFPMHASANIGPDGDTAVFFGLSGTGKTTLSADPDRSLIGDDEHGWSDSGVFNFEGGCYAKVIRLSREGEPEIYATTERFGTILENVVYDSETRELDLDDDSITENTRASYPLESIPNVAPSRSGGHPKNVVMLTADAFGVLPPIARLTTEQAMFHFVSGYTAKVAGTERGVTEPQATFSACFGAPFLPRHPGVYAKMLGERLREHGTQVWLLNTGWTGGPYGVGRRQSLKHTRAMLTAALSGALSKATFKPDSVFGIDVPTSCPDVPAEVLDQRGTWENKGEYDDKAGHLAHLFRENIKKYEAELEPEVLASIRDAHPA